MHSEDLAKKLAGSNISSKFYRLQPEYKGHRKIKVTVCNVPIQLNGDVLAAYLSEYGDIEDITTSKSSSGTAHGDYFVTICLDWAQNPKLGITLTKGRRVDPGNYGREKEKVSLKKKKQSRSRSNVRSG